MPSLQPDFSLNVFLLLSSDTEKETMVKGSLEVSHNKSWWKDKRKSLLKTMDTSSGTRRDASDTRRSYLFVFVCYFPFSPSFCNFCNMFHIVDPDQWQHRAMLHTQQIEKKVWCCWSREPEQRRLSLASFSSSSTVHVTPSVKEGKADRVVCPVFLSKNVRLYDVDILKYKGL